MKNRKNQKKIIKNACFLTIFRIFFNFGSILEHQTVACLVDDGTSFETPGLLGVYSGDILIFIFVLIFLYDSTIWRFFFKFFKLKPDITLIDLTCIKNITF